MEKECKGKVSIGIDIHKKKCVVCVRADDTDGATAGDGDDQGRILEEISYENTRYHATEFAKRMNEKYGKGNCKAVCESTGNMWIKTVDVLQSEGIPILLANPVKTRAIAEASVKTDRVDAGVLAHLRRAGLVVKCHIPTLGIRDQRQILRYRESLVQDRTKISNRMNNMLDKYDLKMIGVRVIGIKNLAYLDEQTLPKPQDDYILHDRIRSVRRITEDIKNVDIRIADIASTNEDAKLIMSMTGFDTFGALLLALEIDGIDRFKTPKRLVSWMGMCPTVHQSGNIKYHGRMKKDSVKRVNWMMTQAAQTAARHDDRMKAYYERIAKSHPHQVAITHVANKMGKIIWHMLKTRQPYLDRNQRLYATKLKKIGHEQ